MSLKTLAIAAAGAAILLSAGSPSFAAGNKTAPSVSLARTNSSAGCGLSQTTPDGGLYQGGRGYSLEWDNSATQRRTLTNIYCTTNVTTSYNGLVTNKSLGR